MAKAPLQYVSDKVDKELNNIEESKLKETGKTREHYEKLVEDLTENISKQENQIIEFILRNDGELDFHRI